LAAKKKRPSTRAPAPSHADDSSPTASEHAEDGDRVDDESGEGEGDGEDLDDEALERDAVIEAEAELVDEAALSVPSTGPASSSAITRADPLAAYMTEVQRYPLLTPDEEHRLAVEYAENGSRQAAERLVTANLRLVVKIAYEYRRAYRNMLDLVQEGNIGLMQAVARYDPYRGVKLSSYSAWWIRAYMLRFILNNWRLVKIGTTQAQRKLFFNLNKEKARLAARGIDPTHELIAENLDVAVRDVAEMDRRLSRNDASLDVPVGDSEGRQTTRMELLPASTDNPEQVAVGTELAEVVREHLDEFRGRLSGKELEIFEKRLVAQEPLTLQQLGDEFGVSRERVRQLEARLVGRLREFLTERLGDAVAVGG
jgi:RNA polymerase sigma-32 factor